MAQPASLRNKFASVNLNSSYGKPAASQQQQQQPRQTSRIGVGHYGGMVILGKGRGKGSSGIVGAGSAPGGAFSQLDKSGKLAVLGPVNLPSLRTEHLGNDPTVALVERAGGGWGKTGAGRMEGVVAPSQGVVTALAGGGERECDGVGNAGGAVIGATRAEAAPHPPDPGVSGTGPLSGRFDGGRGVVAPASRSQVYVPPAVRAASAADTLLPVYRDQASRSSGLSPVISTRVLFHEDFPSLAAATQPQANLQRKLKEQQARQREQHHRVKLQQLKLQQLSEQHVEHLHAVQQIQNERQLEHQLTTERRQKGEDPQKGEMSVQTTPMAKLPPNMECGGLSRGKEQSVTDVEFPQDDVRRPSVPTHHLTLQHMEGRLDEEHGPSEELSSSQYACQSQQLERVLLGAAAEGLQRVENDHHPYQCHKQNKAQSKRDEEGERWPGGDEGKRSVVSPWIPMSRNWADDERDSLPKRAILDEGREEIDRAGCFLRADGFASDKGRDGYSGGSNTVGRRGVAGVDIEPRGGSGAKFQGGAGGAGYIFRRGGNSTFCDYESAFLSRRGGWAEGPETPLVESRRLGHLAAIRSALSGPFREDMFGVDSVGSSRLGRREEDTREFHDPVREAFDAELELVQLMQEQERQKKQQEKEMVAERARVDQEEHKRREKEEEYLLTTVKEVQEVRGSAEREVMGERERALQMEKKLDEEKRQRDLERQRYDAEERIRRENAAKKLKELEERIARREAEKKSEEEQQRQQERNNGQEQRLDLGEAEGGVRREEQSSKRKEDWKTEEDKIRRKEENEHRGEDERRRKAERWREDEQRDPESKREEERMSQEDDMRKREEERMCQEENMREEATIWEPERGTEEDGDREEEQWKMKESREEEHERKEKAAATAPFASGANRREEERQRGEDDDMTERHGCGLLTGHVGEGYTTGGSYQGSGSPSATSHQDEDLLSLSKSSGGRFAPISGGVYRPPCWGGWSESGLRADCRGGGRGGSEVFVLDRLRSSSAPSWRTNLSMMENGVVDSGMPFCSPSKSVGESPVYSPFGRDSEGDFHQRWNRDKERDREKVYNGRGDAVGNHEGREYGWTHGVGLRLGSPRVRRGGATDSFLGRNDRTGSLPFHDLRSGSAGDAGPGVRKPGPGLSSISYGGLDMADMGVGPSSLYDSRDSDRRRFRDRGRERLLMIDNRGGGGTRRTREGYYPSMALPQPKISGPYGYGYHSNSAARSVAPLSAGQGLGGELNLSLSSSFRGNTLGHGGPGWAEKELASQAREQERIVDEGRWRASGDVTSRLLPAELEGDSTLAGLTRAVSKNAEGTRKPEMEDKEVDITAVGGIGRYRQEDSSAAFRLSDDDNKHNGLIVSPTRKLVGQEEAEVRKPSVRSMTCPHGRNLRGVSRLDDNEETDLGDEQEEYDCKVEEERQSQALSCQQKEEEKRDGLRGNECRSHGEDEKFSEMNHLVAGGVCRYGDEDGDDDCGVDVDAGDVGETVSFTVGDRELCSDLVRRHVEGQGQLHVSGSEGRYSTETEDEQGLQTDDCKGREDILQKVDEVQEDKTACRKEVEDEERTAEKDRTEHAEALDFIPSRSSSLCLQQINQSSLILTLKSRPGTPVMSLALDQQGSGMLGTSPEEEMGHQETFAPEQHERHQKMHLEQHQLLVIGQGLSLQGVVSTIPADQEQQQQAQVGFHSGKEQCRQQLQEGSFVPAIAPMMQGQLLQTAAPLAIVVSSQQAPQTHVQQQHYPPPLPQCLSSSPVSQQQLQQQLFQQPQSSEQSTLVAAESPALRGTAAGQGEHSTVAAAVSCQQQHQQQRLQDLVLEHEFENIQQHHQLQQQFVSLPQSTSTFPCMSRPQEQPQTQAHEGLGGVGAAGGNLFTAAAVAPGGEAAAAGGLLPASAITRPLALGFQTSLPSSIHVGSIPLQLTPPHAPHLMSSLGSLPHSMLFPSLASHHQQTSLPLIAPSLPLAGQVLLQSAHQEQQGQSQHLIQQTTDSSMRIPVGTRHHDCQQQQDAASAQVLQQQQQQQLAMISLQREVREAGMLGQEQSIVVVQAHQQGQQHERTQWQQSQQPQQRVERQQSLCMTVLQQQHQQIPQQMLAPQHLQQGSLQPPPPPPLQQQLQQQQLLHQQLQHQMQQLHQLQQLHQHQQLQLQHLQRFHQAHAFQAPTALWGNFPLLPTATCLVPDPKIATVQPDSQVDALLTDVAINNRQLVQHRDEHQEEQQQEQGQERLGGDGERRRQQQRQWEEEADEMKVVTPAVLIAPAIASGEVASKGTATTTTYATSVVAVARIGAAPVEIQACSEKRRVANGSSGKQPTSLCSRLSQENGRNLMGSGISPICKVAAMTASATVTPSALVTPSAMVTLKQNEGEKMSAPESVDNISVDLAGGGQRDMSLEKQQQRLFFAPGVGGRGWGVDGAGGCHSRGMIGGCMRGGGALGRGKGRGGTGGSYGPALRSAEKADSNVPGNCLRGQQENYSEIGGRAGLHRDGGQVRGNMSIGSGITSAVSTSGVVLRTRPSQRGMKRSGELRNREKRWVAPERRRVPAHDNGDGGGGGGGTSGRWTCGRMGDSMRGGASQAGGLLSCRVVMEHQREEIERMMSGDGKEQDIVHDSRKGEHKKTQPFRQGDSSVVTAAAAEADGSGSEVKRTMGIRAKNFGSGSATDMDSQKLLSKQMIDTVPAAAVRKDITSKHGEKGGLVEVLAACSAEVGSAGMYFVPEATEAPLHTGVVRVFEQPGIETVADNDDFIKVRSKRQIYNDKKEQRVKDNRCRNKDTKSKEQEKGGGGAGHGRATVVQKVTVAGGQFIGSGSEGKIVTESLSGIPAENGLLHSSSSSLGSGGDTGVCPLSIDSGDAANFLDNSIVHPSPPVVQQWQQQQQRWDQEQQLELGAKMSANHRHSATPLSTLTPTLHAMPKSNPVTNESQGKSMRLSLCYTSAPAFVKHVVKADLVHQVFIAYVRPVSESKREEEPTPPAVEKLLKEFADLGETKDLDQREIKHRIEIEADSKTPKGPIYQMSPKELDELHKQLDELIEKGWIKPSSSSYDALVLFLLKKEGELRMCNDYRDLNATTVKNAEPLPRIDDLLDRVQITVAYADDPVYNEMIKRVQTTSH
ncbi:hypothetical protein CBR_g34112 [Chara braunii]|uniref:Uncharacterized protein n=1 Tax=Chara braunii TaxID=69332 RepID=A0A388LHY4_CHABU|nr:hypothetical protein CBR_g34112 [Chara braunii]|eukprot:GBG81930.1 hypothetical protein CBR_g34112 [Chara braunii]